ncbi:hypothetical protein H4S07_001229 [Coemansia furcata]|uniref:Uncharacterized protein n=1 Tax=Coemansia furcata TaxID=417177 RepID=A0ACC1LNV1_9FUNG|nr:hypothetical protein H4S07_001229 [Coemansia furcata]
MVPRIAGGEPVPNNDLKYVAFVQAVKDSMGSTCTGSLIAPNVVLTAAHCIYRNSTQLYAAKEFQVGFTHKTPDTSKKYQGYSVSKIVLLSSFNIATLKTDIAILVLSDNVPNDVASPVQIYSGDFNTDTPLLAAGFGMTNATDSNSTPANLMEVSLKVGSDDYCKSKSGSYDHKVNICTDGTPGKDTCRGDSGGPLLTPVNNGSNKYALIGITSYTPVNAENPNGLCAQANSSGVYTRVAPYISWIAQYANLNATAISITNITATHSDSVVSSKSGASLNWLSSDLDPIDEVDSDNGDIFGEPSIIYASISDSYTNDAKASRFMLTTSIGYVAIGAVIAIIALV